MSYHANVYNCGEIELCTLLRRDTPLLRPQAMMITPMTMVMSKMITAMMFLEQNWFRHWLEPLGRSHRCFRRNHLLLSVRINIIIIDCIIITIKIVTIIN